MRVALIQLNSGSDPERNLETIGERIAEAAGQGARLAVLPENATFMGRVSEKARHAESVPGPTTDRLGRWAREHGLAVLLGSLPETCERPDRVYNTAVLMGADGSLIATYRKIHLFDPELEGITERESDGVLPGNAVVTAEVEGACLGLSVCYDLRFPELYRRLADGGAGYLAVPAAFTVPTGRAHWRVLLRARAIENGAFVLAPAQWGRHGERRETYGHSLVVNPWGDVILEIGTGVAVRAVDCDPAEIDRARQQLPTHKHRRRDLFP